ncbi:glycosyltransferase involved in cell wall biosynthesis [Methylohalomonas lacus]|uniref:Glycosyltransferase involved in cell wall biosynthesis n=1 Tax=Methylohalomonas lacus TaxID=398773 RepID=A0AAE3HNB3_9GAMM|nr:glycosyltransferase [Methylohalomonas lacus]MCS3904319.1 glycosyltransferase involved in cell wall biosynthesis [Methylohalomonas lacus]
MFQEKISVIIPAYNRGRYIRQTVESVLNQTYTNMELIVIDDGSTDDSRDILEGYGDRITLLEHDGRQNRGQSASINLGLDRASGEYLAILDSDDYWEPNKIESQVEYLEQHPEIGLVYGNGTAVSGNGEFLYNIYPPTHLEENKPEKVLLNCYFSLPSNALMRMGLLRKAGYFDETLRAGQDHDMAVRIAEVARLAYIDEHLFHYRRHGESISKSNKGAVSRWNNGFVILEKARKRYPYPPAVIRKRKAVLYFRLFQCACENQPGLRALRNLLLAGLNDPARALGVLLRREKIGSPH